MNKKDIRLILQDLQRRGYKIKRGGRGGSGHHKVYDGKKLVTSIPSSPSEYRSLPNSLGYIRRYERDKNNERIQGNDTIQ